jgi:hypothetical protein
MTALVGAAELTEMLKSIEIQSRAEPPQSARPRLAELRTVCCGFRGPALCGSGGGGAVGAGATATSSSGCRIRPLQMPRRKWAGIRLPSQSRKMGLIISRSGNFGDSLS